MFYSEIQAAQNVFVFFLVIVSALLAPHQNSFPVFLAIDADERMVIVQKLPGSQDYRRTTESICDVDVCLEIWEELPTIQNRLAIKPADYDVAVICFTSNSGTNWTSPSLNQRSL